MVDFDVVPQRTALVNVDMLSCFVEGSPIAAPDGLGAPKHQFWFATECLPATATLRSRGYCFTF